MKANKNFSMQPLARYWARHGSKLKTSWLCDLGFQNIYQGRVIRGRCASFKVVGCPYTYKNGGRKTIYSILPPIPLFWQKT